MYFIIFKVITKTSCQMLYILTVLLTLLNRYSISEDFNNAFSALNHGRLFQSDQTSSGPNDDRVKGPFSIVHICAGEMHGCWSWFEEKVSVPNGRSLWVYFPGFIYKDLHSHHYGSHY